MDDAELGGLADSLKGRARTQNDLGRLEERSTINQVRFDQDQCKVLHLGCNNCMHKYSTTEKDLRIPVPQTSAEEMQVESSADYEGCQTLEQATQKSR